MDEAATLDARGRGAGRMRLLASRAADFLPTHAEAGCAVASALLLLLAFPDFGLWPLAWVGLAPLLYAVARRPRAPQAFLLGWLAGTIFFYASCHWLTYPMIHYAELPAWLAYPLLLPVTLVAGLFPALCLLALARACARWGARALVCAPPLWAATEWARLGVIGQLWNAVGYSQTDAPALIQAARFGGVYAVSFLIVAVNAALAYALVRRSVRATVAAVAVVACVALLSLAADFSSGISSHSGVEQPPSAVVVALQPNVMPDFDRPAAEYSALAARHFEMSGEALRALDAGGGAQQSRGGDDLSLLPRVVVWPESPMNFRFAGDSTLRAQVARFTREGRASLLFNSLEPAPNGGGYNAAVLVNEEGRVAVQYDKIRLMPFGEYVPLPRWMPGAGLVRGIVGEFTPGTRYALMPLGSEESAPRAGVFICLESAYPYITRRFTQEGADVLIEMTNDAYQGDTAVLRQHLSNAVFRAVETGRPLLRVTNTGITARITPDGRVFDAAPKFREAARVWPVARSGGAQTFYVRHGDLFAALCAAFGLLAVLATLTRRRTRRADV